MDKSPFSAHTGGFDKTLFIGVVVARKEIRWLLKQVFVVVGLILVSRLKLRCSVAVIGSELKNVE